MARHASSPWLLPPLPRRADRRAAHAGPPQAFTTLDLRPGSLGQRVADVRLSAPQEFHQQSRGCPAKPKIAVSRCGAIPRPMPSSSANLFSSCLPALHVAGEQHLMRLAQFLPALDKLGMAPLTFECEQAGNQARAAFGPRIRAIPGKPQALPQRTVGNQRPGRKPGKVARRTLTLELLIEPANEPVKPGLLHFAIAQLRPLIHGSSPYHRIDRAAAGT